MGNLRIGDYVARKSYRYDILFKIVDIIKRPNRPDQLILKGVSLRIIADSPENDLYKVPLSKMDNFKNSFDKIIDNSIDKIMDQRKKENISSSMERSLGNLGRRDAAFGKAGKVLHIDGDGEYLELCLKTYKKLEIEAVGKQISESEQPKVIKELLREYMPDILVVTGHDGLVKGFKDFKNIHSYRNSNYFIDTVKTARKYESNMDDLVIFAGACQSHYEAILNSGANFASSPHRVLIHCLDPVFICEKVAYTSVDKFVSMEEALENTITGVKGVGGLQTRGKYRHGLPKSPYQ